MRSTKGLKEASPAPFGPPFNDADADIILRSSDQVDFHVYEVILSKSSPFFKSMFSLPQPDTNVSEKQVSIINMTENRRTIAVLLTFIYPVQFMPSLITELVSLDNMIDAFMAARKYDMDVVFQRLLQNFAESKVVRDSPVEAFCAAYSYELGEAARVAAMASLKHRMDLDTIGDKLRCTSGDSLHQLWKFHRACSATAAAAVSDKHLTWIARSDLAWWEFASHGSSYVNCSCHTPFRYILGSSEDWYVDAMWQSYITLARDALSQQPCKESVILYALKPSSEDKTVCHHCHRSLLGLPEFIRLLGDEVERRVSKVDLELPF